MLNYLQCSKGHSLSHAPQQFSLEPYQHCKGSINAYEYNAAPSRLYHHTAAIAQISAVCGRSWQNRWVLQKRGNSITPRAALVL